jgi:sec-independent protein translocase protein TatA
MGLDNPLHIAFLVVILLLVFGAKRLPEIGRSLGSGMREFKQGITGDASAQQPQQQQPALTAAPERRSPAGAEQAPVAAPAAQPAPPEASVEPQPVEPQHHT